MDLDWGNAFESRVRAACCEMPFMISVLRYDPAWLSNQGFTFEPQTFIRPEAADVASRGGEFDKQSGPAVYGDCLSSTPCDGGVSDRSCSSLAGSMGFR